MKVAALAPRRRLLLIGVALLVLMAEYVGHAIVVVADEVRFLVLNVEAYPLGPPSHAWNLSNLKSLSAQADVPDATAKEAESNATTTTTTTAAETNRTAKSTGTDATGTTATAPATAAPAAAAASVPVYGSAIYGPFIRGARDHAVLMRARGEPPAVLADKEGRGGGGAYYPTGPQGWYENGYGSNYHSACE